MIRGQSAGPAAGESWKQVELIKLTIPSGSAARRGEEEDNKREEANNTIIHISEQKKK